MIEELRKKLFASIKRIGHENMAQIFIHRRMWQDRGVWWNTPFCMHRILAFVWWKSRKDCCYLSRYYYFGIDIFYFRSRIAHTACSGRK